MNLFDFQFLYPAWFVAIFLLSAIFFLKAIRLIKKSNFSKIADEHLIKYLTNNQIFGLVRKSNKSNKKIDSIKGAIQPWFFRLGLFLVALFLIVSLASPVWQKLPAPIFDGGYRSLVVVLDLSQSMNAQDILPNRLERAKFKIREILKLADYQNNQSSQNQQRNNHSIATSPIEVGLVVYSNLAYVVSPITSDTTSIEPLLAALNTDLMPTYGSRLQSGINKANQLLNQSGIKEGNILVISDSVESANFREIQLIARQHKIHLLAVGTENGSEIPSSNGGSITNLNGEVVVSKLNLDLMRAFNQASNGEFEMLRLDNQDIRTIIDSLQSNQDSSFIKEQNNADVYHQEYFWFLLFAMAIFLGYFRKGAFVLMTVPLVFSPFDLKADEQSENILYSKDWNGLQNFKSGYYEQAIEQFEDLRWKASSLFKNGAYQEALELWKQFNGGDDFYNQGNSYAKLSLFEKAIESYDRAIEINPNHQEAIENRKRVLDYLENQQDQQNRQDNQEGESSNSSENSQQGGGNSEQQNNENSQNEQSNQSNQSNQNGNQQGGRGSQDNQSNQSSENQKQNQGGNEGGNQLDNQQDNQANQESQGNQNEKNQERANNQSGSDSKNQGNESNQDQQSQQQNQGQSDNKQGNSNQSFKPNPNQFDEKIGNQDINQEMTTQENDANGNQNNVSNNDQTDNPSNNQFVEENQSKKELEGQDQSQSSQAIITPNINPEQTEKQIYLMQRLQQVEDDPGELLRRKFLYQYKSNQISPDLLDQPY